MDPAAFANPAERHNNSMRHDVGIIADNNIVVNDSKRIDGHIVANFCMRMDGCQR
jgi:hypothetical protein